MDAKLIRKLFGEQLKELYRLDQKLTYIQALPRGERKVVAIRFWNLGELIEEFEWSKELQKGHILPVFYRKDEPELP